MRRAESGEACAAPAPRPPTDRLSEKELLRRQLLSSSKDRNADRLEQRAKRVRPRQKNRWKLIFHHQALPQEYLDHYEQSLKASAKTAKEQSLPAEALEPWAQRLAGGPRDGRRRTSKVVTYDDLPYMGEMTLDDAKPRRGRKPKKADICHLIYENYGTVVPGQPAPGGRCSPSTGRPARTDLHNRLITSLLERKLSLESKRKTLGSPDEPMPAAPPTAAGPLHSDDEPLNLCIRDLRDLKIQIQRKFGNIYTSAPDVKAEEGEQPNAISVIQRNTTVSPPAGYVCWPDAGVYVHPLALQTQLLYCQRLAAAGQPPLVRADESLHENRNKLVLKQLSELLDPTNASRPDASPEPAKKRASPNPNRGTGKRKRSAIFVPPVPAKHDASTPTAEVSICKFKFTGGSKPSLQEKKMLSVDSGGNFRYYSGTGGKAAKGYDYIQKNSEERAQPLRPPPSPATPEAPASPEAAELGKKKRKSRKTLHREKLEQTFKEKGFLIQTQQLQSAEGATYCKFRQLRKFTRYLFRSWKDYLPGELDEKAQQEGAPATGGWG